MPLGNNVHVACGSSGVTIKDYIEKVRASARPINDKRGTVEFRIQVIGVIAKRALNMALERIR